MKRAGRKIVAVVALSSLLLQNFGAMYFAAEPMAVEASAQDLQLDDLLAVEDISSEDNGAENGGLVEAFSVDAEFSADQELINEAPDEEDDLYALDDDLVIDPDEDVSVGSEETEFPDLIVLDDSEEDQAEENQSELLLSDENVSDELAFSEDLLSEEDQTEYTPSEQRDDLSWDVEEDLLFGEDEYFMSPDGKFYCLILNGTYASIASYKGSDAEVEVPRQIGEYIIQEIGKEAFRENERITKVTLPDSVKVIREEAFRGCSSLKTFISGSGLKTIEAAAFSECSQLLDVQLNEGLIDIYAYAFEECGSLKEADLPDTVERIGYRAFANCNSLEQFHYPANLEEIPGGLGSYSWEAGEIFSGCISMNTFTIPEDETVVLPYLLCGCSDITEVVLPDGLKTVGEYAFEGAAGLTEMTLPDQVESIGEHAFAACTSLETVNIPASVETIGCGAFENCSSLTELNLSEGLVEIWAYAFSRCESLTEVVLPDSVTTIGYQAFLECTGLETVNYPLSLESCPGSLGSYSWEEGELFYGCESLVDFEIPEGITFVPAFMFKNCEYLEDVSFSNSLTEIEESAFEGCSRLASLDLPAGLTRIDCNAFCGCTGLRILELPESLEVIENSAFENCAGLVSIVFPDSLREIWAYAFRGCNGLKKLELSDSIESIGYMAFAESISLASVRLPAGLLDTPGGLGSYSWEEGDLFTGCNKLKEIKLPEGMTTLPSYSLRELAAVTRVRLPESMRSIGEYACAGSAMLEKIWIGENVSVIAENAFEDCKVLTIHGVAGSFAETYANQNGIPFSTDPIEAGEGILKGHVSDQDGNAIEGVQISIYRISTEEKIDTVLTDDEGEWSFDNAVQGQDYLVSAEHPLYQFTPSQIRCAPISQEVTLEDFTGELIQDEPEEEYGENFSYEVLNGYYIAITGYTGSETVFAVPSEIDGYVVQKIGAGAFEGNTTLQKILLPETLETIGEKAFYNCKRLTWVGMQQNVRSIENSAFENCSSLKDVSFGSGLEEIWALAFCGCTSLAKLKLPETVQKIGYQAFANDTSLREVHYPICWKDCPGGLGSYSWERGSLFNGCISLDEITIPEGVTRIPSYAFSDSAYPGRFSWPDSLKSVGSYAFSRNTGLTQLTLPVQVEEIEEHAFEECTSLANVNLPASVGIIGNNAFDGCSSLTGLLLLEGLEEIWAYAFRKCESLKNVVIPDTVTTIGYQAFAECTALESANYPLSLEICPSGLGAYSWEHGEVFVDCENLLTFEIPEGITSVAAYMFKDCVSLTGVSLPDTLTEIEEYAFNGCSGLKAIDLPAGVSRIDESAFNSCTGLRTLTLPASLEVIENSAFENCTGLVEIEFPDSLKEIWAYAFRSCKGLRKLEISDSVEKIGYMAFADCTTLTGALLPTGLLDTPEGLGCYSWEAGSVFAGCTKLKEVTIPEGIVTLPGSSLAELPGVTKIWLPESMRTVEDRAFKDSEKLEKIWIGENVTQIGEEVFENCTVLTIHGIAGSYAESYAHENGIPFSTDPMEKEEETLKGLVSDQNGNPIEGVQVIICRVSTEEKLDTVYTDEEGGWIYSNAAAGDEYLVSAAHPLYRFTPTQIRCTAVKGELIVDPFTGELITPMPEEESGDHFSYDILNGNYIAITGYTGTKTAFAIPSEIDGYVVQEIAESAFEDNVKIEKIMLPESLEIVGENAFRGCNKLAWVGMQQNVSTIKNSAFENCLSLKDVSFGSGLEEIWAYAFTGCTKLAYLNLPDSLRKIGYCAFSDETSLKEVHYPLCWKDCPGGLGSYSWEQGAIFNGCTSLTDITVPEGVTRIPSFAFSNCPNLKQITYPATLKKVGDYAFYNDTGFRELTLPSCVEEIEKFAYSGCGSLETIKIPASVELIGPDAFEDCTSLTELELSEGLKEIWAYAFQRCESLKEVAIPDSVTTIGYHAFADCTGLEKVNYPFNLEECPGGIGSYSWEQGEVFFGCTLLEEIDFPDGIQTIAGFTFKNSPALKTLTLPASVTTVGENAFAGCTALEDVTLPNGLTTLEKGAFEECSVLAKIVLPTGMEEIGSCAFKDCAMLNDVTIPATVTVICDSAFENCDSLEQIGLPENLKEIWAYAFSGCDLLRTLVIPAYTEKIGYMAFAKDKALRQVSLPAIQFETPGGLGCYSWESGHLFDECEQLRSIILPEGMTAIPDELFVGNDKLRNIRFASTIKTIGESAFSGCKGLPGIDLNEGLVSIRERAFESCEGLVSVVIPDGVKNIEDYAFRGCKNLTSIYLPPSVNFIGDETFEGCPDELCLYVAENSYAAVWAITHGFDFVFVSYYGTDYSNYALDMSASDFYTNTNLTLINQNLVFYLDYRIKDELAGKLSDEKVRIGLGTGLSFVTGSLKVDGITTETDDLWEEDGSLVIPVTSQSGRIVFNAKVTRSGKNAAYGYFSYRKDGKDCTDIAGMVALNVPILTVEAATPVAAREISVEGVAEPGNNVNLYVDGTKQAAVKAGKTGLYSQGLLLPSNPVDGHQYEIKAELASDKTVVATTKVQFFSKVPILRKFDMLYNSNTSNRLDLLATEGKKLTLSYNPAYPLTFIVDFDNAEYIEKVYVASRKNGADTKMQALPSAKEGRYIASGYFDPENHNYVPGDISVYYLTKAGEVGEIEGYTFPDQEDLPDELKGTKSELVSQTDETVRIQITFPDGTSGEAEISEFSLARAYEIYLPDDLSSVENEDPLHASEEMQRLYASPDEEDVLIFFNKFRKKYDKAIRKRMLTNDGTPFYEMETSEGLKYVFWDTAKETFREVGFQYLVYSWLRDYPCVTNTYSSSLTWGIAGSFIDGAKLIGKAWQIRESLDEAERLIRSDKNMTDTDKEYALARVQNVRDAYTVVQSIDVVLCFAKPFITAAATAAWGPVGGMLAGVVISGIQDIVHNYLDDALVYYTAGGKGIYLFWMIDPSGYVYAGVPDNRIEGATVSAWYRQSMSSPPVLWDASEYEQDNPLISASDGSYAWDTPEGYWQVVVEKDGYETWQSDWMTVPPVRDDVNANLIAAGNPEILWTKAAEDRVEILFDQPVKPGTVNGIVLKDKSGKTISYHLEYAGQPAVDGTVYGMKFDLVYDTASLNLGDTVSMVSGSGVTSYTGRKLTSQTIDLTITGDVIFEVPERAELDYGGRTMVQVTAKNLGDGHDITAESRFPEILKVISVEESSEEGVWNVCVEGRLPGCADLSVKAEGTGFEAVVKVDVAMNDTFEGFDDDEPEWTISLDKDAVSLYVSESDTVTVSNLHPMDKVVSWKSSDENIAVVDNGKITGIAPGTAKVTVTLQSGLKAEVIVTVKIKMVAPEMANVYNSAKGGDIRWKAVADCAGYKVYRQRSSEGIKVVTTVNDPSVTQCIDTEIKDNRWGCVYHYYVTALYNEGGKTKEGPKSSKLVLQRLAPMKITSTALNGRKAIDVAWECTVKDNKALGYEVHYAESSSDLNNRKGTFKKVAIDGRKNMSATLKNLTRGKTYYIRVRCYVNYTHSVTHETTKTWSQYSSTVKVKVP